MNARILILLLLLLPLFAAGQKYSRYKTYPFPERVALGDIPGTTVLNKFGAYLDFASADPPADVWTNGGDYPGFPTDSAQAIIIVSDSLTDTLNGTGAWYATVYGLDENWELQTVTYELTGTSPDTSAEEWWRVFRVIVDSAGTNGVNNGEITITHQDGTTLAVVESGIGQTLQACYTVPAGYSLYVRDVHAALNRANGAAASGLVALMVRDVGTGAWNSKVYEPISTGHPLDVSHQVLYPEKTDLRLRVISTSDNDCSISGSFLGYLVLNN